MTEENRKCPFCNNGTREWSASGGRIGYNITTCSYCKGTGILDEISAEYFWNNQNLVKDEPKPMIEQVVINSSCIGIDATKFDMMLVDPPYSEHVHKNATSQSKGRGARHRDLGFDHLSDELRDEIAKFASQVKRWSLIYSDVEGLSAWKDSCEEAGATYIRPIAWVRWSMPQLSGDRAPQGFELVTSYWGSQKGKKSWNGPGNLTHLSHKCLRGEGKHKAEKPLDQILDLLMWFSNPGDSVFDPCAGSGTVGLACKILGMNYVGYEIDSEWAAKATARIDNCKVSFTDKVVTGLSDRDQERYNRWVASRLEQIEDKKRIEEHTSKIRAKLQST